MRKLVFFSLFCLTFCSCSSEKTCRYEDEYNRAANALKTELERNPSLESLKNPKFKSDFLSDMTHLECADYQREYKLSDEKLREHIAQTEELVKFLKSFSHTGEYVTNDLKIETVK